MSVKVVLYAFLGFIIFLFCLLEEREKGFGTAGLCWLLFELEVKFYFDKTFEIFEEKICFLRVLLVTIYVIFCSFLVWQLVLLDFVARLLLRFLRFGCLGRLIVCQRVFFGYLEDVLTFLYSIF